MSENPYEKDMLRIVAERQLARSAVAETQIGSADELLHELHVHQIELEMQNENLRQNLLELEESRDRYLDFYDFAPVGYITLNRAGMIEEINLTGAALLGVERNKLLGRRFAHFVSAEDRDGWHLHFSKVQECDGVHTRELTLQHGSGGRFCAQLDCMCAGNIDRIIEVRMVMSDITERVRIMDALRNSEESLIVREQESRTLIENSPDTISRYDRDCRRIYANPAFGAMVEGGVSALLGKKPSEYPGGPNSDIYEIKINYVFATGKDAQFELKWPDKDGKVVCSHVRLTAERDSSGTIISVLGVGRDITELNDSRTELKSKELAKTRFLAAAGHDLRQPLAAANLFIDALKLTEPTSRQNEIIQRLDQSMSTFNGLLDALLNVSKLDAGMIKPEYSSIDVTELFDWLEQNFAPMAGEKQLDLRMHPHTSKALAVRSDIGLLRSILMNLVSNAIKFTAEGGILVSARQHGGNVLFQVWDTGIGIPDEYLGHVYDEFYQVDNPQRDRTKGLGLGLSIVRRALMLLGAEINARSQTGRGSVFEFCMPLDGHVDRIGRTAALVVPQEDVIDKSFAPGKGFVLVEDDALVAQAMINWLEGMGGKVKRFQSAEDALHHANIEHADYYIVDYMLGGMLNGIQFLNLVRLKRGKPINAVLVTGDTSSTFIHHAGSFDWPVLYKPINASKLIACLTAQQDKSAG